jgi:hypothetical protein
MQVQRRGDAQDDASARELTSGCVVIRAPPSAPWAVSGFGISRIAAALAIIRLLL